MTSAHVAEVCRITVHAPGGRIDLAVPLSVPVANLIPVLLRRAAGRPEQDQRAGWVLQRLGEVPLDPSGTPESLDWRDGEEFHLRPARDPLPELDFDDIADGVATSAARHPGRWRPEFNRWLFFGFVVAALVVIGRTLLYAGAQPLTAGGGLVLAAVLVTGSVVVDRTSGDPLRTLLFGLAGCGFAGLGAASLSAGTPAAAALAAGPVLDGGLGVAVAGTVLIAARVISGSDAPLAPFGTVLCTGVLAVIGQWLHLVVGITPAQVAGCLATAMLVVLVFAPRISLRLAGISGPQLPRTADELQRDLDPVSATWIAAHTRDADGYLTVAVVTASVVDVCSFPFLIGDGVIGLVLTGLISLAAVLRSRGLHSAWQRVPLAATGGIGVGLAGLSMVPALGMQGRLVAVLVCCAVTLALLLAMTRPPTRRMRPIWGHLANIAETLISVAVLPVLLQVFDVYAQARGLAG